MYTYRYIKYMCTTNIPASIKFYNFIFSDNNVNKNKSSLKSQTALGHKPGF